MARVLLDSTVLIDALRGRPAAARILALREQGDQVWSCAICAEEIWRGVLPGEHEDVARLFAGLMPAPIGFEEGVLAGTWRRDFARRGVTLHQADCLIAASAVRVGARLATGNPGDFPMDELAVEDWPVGR